MLGTRLQRKTLLVIVLTFVALFFVLYEVSRSIVLGSFAEQEVIESKQNVERVVGALNENLRTLEGTSRDWSLWDDTARYVQDLNTVYYDTNLANIQVMMENNHLNMVLLLDKNDQIVFQTYFDYNTGTTLSMPTDLGEHVYPGGSLLDHKDSSSSIKGVIFLSQAPMLLASEPIMSGDGTGPVVGTLIFGRSLDKEAIEHLSQVTLLGVTFSTIEGAMNSDTLKNILPMLGTSSDIILNRISASTIEGSRLIDDVYGNPTLIMNVKMARDMYQRGEQSFNYYITTLIVVGVVFAIVIMALLSKLVLHRLSRLRTDVRIISENTDMTGRVRRQGNDELSDVADSINEMLAALERTREEQREGEERYRAVVEQTNEAILLAEVVTGRFVEANPAAQILLGYDRNELLSLGSSDIVERPVRDTGALIAHGTTGRLKLSTEQKFRRKDCTLVHVEVSEIQIRYGGKDVLCIVARDITERKRAEELLRELAMRDGLTGLYNRREMHRILKEQIERYRRYGDPATLILMDIDYFKSVNDTYGHQIGDEVIRWIGALTQDVVRLGDRLARYGGEEFALVLPGGDSTTAFKVAERIRLAVAHQPFVYTGQGEAEKEQLLIPITVSLGVAILPENGNTEESIIKAADTALYAAKRAGRNRTTTFDMLEEESLARVTGVL